MTTTCPSCGTGRSPWVTTHNVRDEHDRPHTITFYNCECGFSTWDVEEYDWAKAAGARADVDEDAGEFIAAFRAHEDMGWRMTAEKEEER